jgi:ABC-type transport system involved in cytochrome c biogenesis permease subunit
MISIERLFPWVVVGVGLLYLLTGAFPPNEPEGQMRLQEFGKIPVVANGRVKPMDTLARTTLMVICSGGQQTFKDPSGNEQPAVKWLLDAMTDKLGDKHPSWNYKVFRIEDLQILNLLGLEHRPMFWKYAINEFGDKMDLLNREANRANDLPPRQRDLFDVKLLELAQHLDLYMKLAQWRTPLSLPPQSPDEEWKSLVEGLMEAQRGERENPAARSLGKILLAYAEGNAETFNREVADYRQQLAQQIPEEARYAEFEAFFNHFEPFVHCSYLYVMVFALALVSWLIWTEPLGRAAFWLAVLTLAVHTWALAGRMYLQGRPPVTNLYSAAVFVGWVGIVIALILEALFRKGIGTVVAALVGFATMKIALFLGESGDTLQMMEAVLDTNFWLATHVTIVTSGYAATIVAGTLGTVFVLLGVFTPWLNRDLFKSLAQMIYGIVCFAALASFTGTVLGGIWADQSWGRFWGWDPKENGALIIVIWNALILHARWAGMVKQRGMAVLAILGNMVTAWSFFGTNQLGVGLHAYGFSERLAVGLRWYWGSQIAFIALGLIPTSLWRSFGETIISARPRRARASS